jgi:hypothetical protein
MKDHEIKAKELVDKPKCQKCETNNVGARFLGKDICIECYDLITKALKSLR